MQIILSAQDIKDAIVASLAGNISLTGKHVDVTFTSGRSRNDLTANVVIGTKPAMSAAVTNMPDFNDDPVETEIKTPAPEVEAPVVVEAAAETEVKPTTGSLFKATAAAQ